MLTNYVLGQAYLDSQVQKIIRQCFPLSAKSMRSVVERGARQCCSEYSRGSGCLQCSQGHGCLNGSFNSNSLQRATPDENQLTQRGYLKVFLLYLLIFLFLFFYLYLKPSSFAIFTGNHQLILLHFPLECVPNSFLIHVKLVNIISTK